MRASDPDTGEVTAWQRARVGSIASRQSVRLDFILGDQGESGDSACTEYGWTTTIATTQYVTHKTSAQITSSTTSRPTGTTTAAGSTASWASSGLLILLVFHKLY